MAILNCTVSNLICIFSLANEQSLQTSDTGEFASAASSESNVYSVFGGEFVASKQGKPLERERLVSCSYVCCTLFDFND